MNFFLRLAPCALGWLLAACHSDTKPTAGASTNSVASAPATAAALADSPGACYRQYRGLRPGTTDTLELSLLVAPPRSDNSELEGFFASYHGPDGHPYQLIGYPSRAADSVLLADISPEIVPEGDAGANWRLRRNKTELVGTLNGQPVRLREARSAGSLAFAVRCFADSVVAFPGVRNSPVGHVSLQGLVPQASSPVLEANLLRQMRGDTLPDAPESALPTIWTQCKAEFQKMYRESAQESRQEAAADSSADTNEDVPFGYGLSYEQQTATYVLWNRAPLLSIGVFNYGYSGGAHGNYSTDAATYDTRTGQRLRFADIFRPGTDAQLSKALDQAVRRTLHIPAEDPLDLTLFVTHMPVTRNFYLTSSGAVFIYSPYEIASYAQGEVHVFVPLSELTPLMVPMQQVL